MDQENKKINLCYFISEDWYFISHRFELAKALIKENYEIKLICKISVYRKLIEDAGIEVIDINFKRSSFNIFNDLINIYKLRKIIFHYNFDILHNVGIKPIIVGSILGLISKVPTIINAFAGMGYLFTSKNSTQFLVRMIFTFCMKFISRYKKVYYLTQNSKDKELLCKIFSLRNSNIFIIPGSGIDIKKNKFYKKNYFHNNKYQIIMHSRILWDKGVKEFFEASQILKKQKFDCMFYLIGKIDYNNPSTIPKEKLLKWSENDNFKWLGYKNNITTYLIKSDISCLPSYREGLPKSILVDCACGTPVITTKIPGCEDIIKDGFNGILINPRSSDSLANAVLCLAKNPKKREIYAKRSRKIIEERFSIEEILKQTTFMYKKILKKND